MTRVCMDCKRILGEKCPTCGQEPTALADGSFFCETPNCDSFQFDAGAGGRTEGLCQECLSKRVAA